jgi:hypothetical protein
MTAMTYRNFDLRIERGGEGEPYNVRAIAPDGNWGTGQFKPPFTHEHLEAFRQSIGRYGRDVSRRRRGTAVQEEEVLRFGDRLFSSVFAGQVSERFIGSLRQVREREEGLRIRLHLTEAPELAELPWEFLYDRRDDRFLSIFDETPIVRYMDMSQKAPTSLMVRLPLSVLVMICNPEGNGLRRLNAGREWENLSEAFRDLQQHNKVSVERVEGGTQRALQRQLRQRDYHIFHFIGHGGFDPDTGDGFLVMENRSGGPDPVGARDLAVLLEHRKLRLAILNACEGAHGAPSDPLAGVAQRLTTRLLVPAVIGMQFSISDSAAITFASEFYDALADGYPVDASLAQARKAIHETRNRVEWGTPMLFLRSPKAQIFEIDRPTDVESRLENIDRWSREAKALIDLRGYKSAIEKLEAILKEQEEGARL